MLLVERIVGNSNEPQWRTRLQAAEIDYLVLDQWEAQKSRLRKSTQQNHELALCLDRNAHLHDGDVLDWDAARGRAIVARIELNEVMVIDLADVLAQDPSIMARTLFELGHALGNQHWPAVVKGTQVFVPLTLDRKVMSSVMKTHALPGVHCEFRAGAEVIPYLAPHEARRLFGGASEPTHTHSSAAGGHDHSGHGHLARDGHAH